MRCFHITIAIAPQSSLPASIFDRLIDREATTESPAVQRLDIVSFDMDAAVRSSTATSSSDEIPFTVGKTHLDHGVIRLFRETAAGEALREARRTISAAPLTETAPLDADVAVDDERFVLCILSIPASMTPADFLQFIGFSTMTLDAAISHVRLVRDAALFRSLALVKFRNAESATDFLRYYDGRAFSSLEPERCRVVRVASVRFVDAAAMPVASMDMAVFPNASDLQSSASSATPLLAELPTCPVCLERLDATVTGLAIIACRHTFHCKCLSGWADERCPVCRYTLAFPEPVDGAAPPSVVTVHCSECPATTHLWVCLVCAHVGCGRYEAAHAYSHFTDSGHSYALEMDTQRVWDYLGDAYVHRLIRDKAAGGRLVDVASELSKRTHSGGEEHEYSDYYPKDEAVEREYSRLVAAQLDSQRLYYEMELERAYAELSLVRSGKQQQGTSGTGGNEEMVLLRERAASLERDLDKATTQSNCLTDQLEREQVLRRLAEKRLERSEARIGAAHTKLEEEKSITRSLVENLTLLRQSLDARTGDIKELQEQVRDLAFALDAVQRVQSGEFGTDVHEGTLEVRPAPNQDNTGKRRIRKK